MFKGLRLWKNQSHKELLVKGHEKGSTVGVHQKKALSVRGHKEELTKGIPINGKR
jgi:hypothetical protein